MDTKTPTTTPTYKPQDRLPGRAESTDVLIDVSAEDRKGGVAQDEALALEIDAPDQDQIAKGDKPHVTVESDSFGTRGG